MLTCLQQINPVVQALLRGCFNWGVTALGVVALFLTSQVKKTLWILCLVLPIVL
jgi:hypothetical protein